MESEDYDEWDDDEEDDDWCKSDFPDSGPFCRHWSTVGDCGKPCACGHECEDHADDPDDDDTECLKCDCPAWKDDVGEADAED